ncbi:LPXTG cell wall anchor domain-containing protein [Propionimicrobium sp. PCR01-08-3]|uniref:LPXTG cell wall anchor domain-containing protein n=1 Tax=Propionimicrobium sp. PCR01-08-3 TaxID=3052086 RepID=UPI00255C29F7|nr:LPXTG cell wall anchor domain-containing protein [Propionimicrobium sp. PCR01-08-3]WIY83166.1 LPXTG cell wall anchor domain-containing protein [Propionimicrobium sp. PCR01-08-3]
MRTSQKVAAGLGALALAGSLSFGTVSFARAAIEPMLTIASVEVDEDDVPVLTDAPWIDATVSGCSEADGVVSIYAQLSSSDLDGHVVWEDTYDAPESGDLQIQSVTPLPGIFYDFDISCMEAADDDPADGHPDSALFRSGTGYLDLTGPEAGGSWATDDEVAISSRAFPDSGAYFPEEEHAFTPGSEVVVSVSDPDGTVTEIGTFTADENGDLSESSVLPYTVEGIYTVTATGTRVSDDQTSDIVLLNQYQQVASEEPAEPSDPETPAEPSDPETPTNPERPTELPKTGSEELGMTSAAAVISIAMGAVAVVLKSRKHD